MKKSLSLLLIITLAFLSFANAQNEENAIKEVIQSAYIDGIHNLGDMDAIEKGFHPGFDLLIKNENGQLVKYPIYSWLESTKKRKAENPEGPEEKTTVEFIDIDITGESAVAKIDLFRDGKRTFTDYLFLYKFPEGWRIVSKVYHRY
jgi:hypothetical protein